ncbi:MAG: histidinol dehydrogenase [Lachnospiraceae bacterium]
MKYYKSAKEAKEVRDAQATKAVADIICEVRQNKDQALKDFAKKFDNAELDEIKVSKDDIKKAYEQVDDKVVESFRKAADQIAFYAKAQLDCIKPLDVQSPVAGVELGHRLIPVDGAGLYVPGGRFPLPSTALMLTIPAKIAGVKRVAACSPANKQFGTIHPATLVALNIAGADEIYTVGGAQAVAAMAYGTESIAKVDLIAGPGNRYVTEAKRQVMGTVGIDSLAGPSEVLIVADETANPEYIAIDLLAQSEHDAFAKSVLVTTDESKVPEILKSMEELAAKLPTGEAAMQSFEDNGTIIIAESMDEMAQIANEAAPEHLEVHTKDPKEYSKKLHQFGSLFIGEDAPVALGDYCSGTNHTLPTMKNARFSNGVWVGTFLKTSFVQYITKEGLTNLSETCMTMAHTEGLAAHEMSVALRLK